MVTRTKEELVVRKRLLENQIERERINISMFQSELADINGRLTAMDSKPGKKA